MFLITKKIAIREGIIPVIKKPRIDMEKTLVTLTPNIENKLIKAASLVPNPFKLIGRRDTKVPIGRIAKKTQRDKLIPRDNPIK